MKKIFLFVLALSILGVSCTAKKSGITGTFTGLTNDTLWIRASVLNDEHQFENKGIDTVVVRDGKFFYEPQTYNLTELEIIPVENIERLPNGMFRHGPGARMVLLFFPGDHIRLDANNKNEIVDFQAKGNFYNEQLSKLNANVQDAYKQRNNAVKIIFDTSFTEDKTVYREQLREAMQVMNNNSLDYIRENPDEPLSAYLVASFQTLIESDKILQYSDSLGIEALNSVFGQILRKKIEYIREYKEREEKKGFAKKEMIGNPAPKFTLKDISGNDFSLSSLRGKYVVLDFWGSWCGWCLVDFPYFKEYYAGHPNEFEIVGIAFSDKMEQWRKVVLETYTLPWNNVFDENDIHEKYYVTSAPTYVLIDKEGAIMDFPMNYYDMVKQLNQLREKGQL